MNKALMEQLELERRKREILKEAQNSGNRNSLKVMDKSYMDTEPSKTLEGRKFAWEYELENYRKMKLKDRFCVLGAFCGILALILTLYFNFDIWIKLF